MTEPAGIIFRSARWKAALVVIIGLLTVWGAWALTGIEMEGRGLVIGIVLLFGLPLVLLGLARLLRPEILRIESDRLIWTTLYGRNWTLPYDEVTAFHVVDFGRWPISHKQVCYSRSAGLPFGGVGHGYSASAEEIVAALNAALERHRAAGVRPAGQAAFDGPEPRVT